VAYTEWHTLNAIIASMGVCVFVGLILLIGRVKNDAIYAKEGMVIVAGSWIILSLFGALPFWFSREIPAYIDALFETVSGFTTTGSSILSGEEIEALPKCLIMWRSFTHWVGGMGVLVFVMAFLPLSGGQNINLMKAESPGPQVSKLVPKVRQTAKILYLIYAAFTVIEFIFLVCGEMSAFEALNTAFATAGTGGFGFRGNSMASFSTYTQVVITVFMLLFSINFTSYYLVLCKRLKEAFNTEVRIFLCVVGVAIAFITLNLCLTNTPLYILGKGDATSEYSVGQAILHAAFSVATVVSTTGFATADFALWPAFSQVLLLLLMFMGACAGSTGGGVKVSRVTILYKGATHEMKKVLRPKQVKRITMDGRVVEDEVVRGVHAYFTAYAIIFVVSLLIIALDCADFTTNFTSVLATLNNIGPGLGSVGPNGGYGGFSALSKIVYIFDMLAGRLEVFPMLLLFSPSTWKK
jgi:trk system potassium uptake protein TrkH